jgi:DNA-binding transcriptional ArsR family regulator
MPLAFPLTDAVVELVAERFKVMGEPSRLRLLDRLRSGEATVQELADALDATQQNVSKHLGVLLRSGIVGRRKDGLFSYYRIVDDSVFAICEVVCGSMLKDAEATASALAGAGRGRR